MSDAGQLRGQVGQAQPVLQERQRDQAEQRAVTVPRPPKIDVPPSTTAVIAISSKPVPASALAWPRRAT